MLYLMGSVTGVGLVTAWLGCRQEPYTMDPAGPMVTNLSTDAAHENFELLTETLATTEGCCSRGLRSLGHKGPL